jgi:hypothetical protein
MHAWDLLIKFYDMILADQDEIRNFVEYPKKHNSWNIRDVYASILVKMWHDVKQQQKHETSTSGRLVSVKRLAAVV